jgi:phosphatidylinositol phospholipase C delta
LAQSTYDQVRERIEKATLRLERAKEQIRSLENSSKYREQLLLQETESRPLVVQHAEKIEERDNCLALIEKATQEIFIVDKNRKQLQLKLEEKAQEWRIQAELASQTRRNADRSAHAAEELLEHAIEEREAAELRHVAYKRAESTVSDRGSQKESLFAQLREAERASVVAAKLAVQSKHRASTLSDELEKESLSRTQQLVDEKKLHVLRLQGELDSAQLLKQHKELEVEKEKQRFNTDSELMKGTMIENVATSQSQVDVLREEDAISAYQSAIQLKDEANKASLDTQVSMNEANVKREIANRASDYKVLMEMTVELPDKLSEVVFLQSCRLRNWTDSLRLSNVHVHSLSQRVLVKRLEENADEAIELKKFTKDHLCRVFPYGKKNKSFPMRAWLLGCQFVGVNLAFPDEQVLLAEGRFRENGSCGYVLKPRSLTHEDVHETEEPQRWALQVISGFNIPSSSNNVNLRVQVKVWTADGEPIVHETDEVRQNCFNPSWANVFDLKISDPSIAIVNFIVYNGSEYLAGASSPVSRWREGFRSVALFNANHSRSGPYEFASLLVQATRHR